MCGRPPERHDLLDGRRTEQSLFHDIPFLEREADVLRAALDVLRACLPSTWKFDSQIPASDRGVDAQFRIRTPDGSEMTAIVEAKRLLNTRDVRSRSNDLDEWRCESRMAASR